MTNQELYRTYIKALIQPYYAAFLVLNPDKRLNATGADFNCWIQARHKEFAPDVEVSADVAYTADFTEYLIGKIKALDLELFDNYTPHDISVVVGEITHTFKPIGVVARVSTDDIQTHTVSEIPMRRQKTGDVEGLPEPSDRILIVSAMVRQALPHRKDLVSPDTGKSAIRKDGQIVAVTGFITN